MSLAAALLILAVLAIPLFIAIQRSTELFVVDVTNGKPEFVRGRMPQRLLDDIGDVVRRPPASGRIRAIVEGGAPRIITSGMSDGQRQAIRNVVGTWKLAQIRAGGRPRR